MTACSRIASIVASMTIYLMSNTDHGDERIINELSRRLDIDPMPNMTRNTWLKAIVMNLLLYGKGNSIVVPHTYNGLLQSMEPISASRVTFDNRGSYTDYRILIDGVPHDPADVLHFRYGTDPTYLWRGRGVDVSLKDVAHNLKQAAYTERGFMESKWKPSVIVKVDALTDEFASPEGRQKLLDEYFEANEAGDPWIIPAEQFSIEQVKPLSLSDLAINDQVTLDKKTVASILGVPAFVLGVGEFNASEWNNFINGPIKDIVQIITQEMTQKLILSPKWYVTMNIWSLYEYDMRSVSEILLSGADRGYVNGDEWRTRMHMSPAGLTEYKVLENYIPYDMSGQQKKLKGESDE